MTETLQATIPAHPNWFVARFIEAQKWDKKGLLDLEPIIAWEVWREDDRTWVLPITLDGTQHLTLLCLIKDPNGRFHEDGIAVCKDEEEALKMLRRRYDVANAHPPKATHPFQRFDQEPEDEAGGTSTRCNARAAVRPDGTPTANTFDLAAPRPNPDSCDRPA